MYNIRRLLTGNPQPFGDSIQTNEYHLHTVRSAVDSFKRIVPLYLIRGIV